MSPTPESVRIFLLKKYESALLDHGLASEKVPDDFDLFTEGIVDSLGVLTMIKDTENHFGIDLDMEAMDAERLTVLASFCEYAAQNGKPRAARPNGVSTQARSEDLDNIIFELRNRVRQHSSIPEDDRDFTDDVHLCNAGYLDEFGMANLRSFMQTKFQVELSQADLVEFPLETLRQMAVFVAKRQKKEI